MTAPAPSSHLWVLPQRQSTVGFTHLVLFLCGDPHEAISALPPGENQKVMSQCHLACSVCDPLRHLDPFQLCCCQVRFSLPCACPFGFGPISRTFRFSAKLHPVHKDPVIEPVKIIWNPALIFQGACCPSVICKFNKHPPLPLHPAHLYKC